MRNQKNIIKSLVVMISFALFSCGNSIVNSSGGNDDVGYDPTQSTNLRTIHFDALQQRLLTTFGLSSGGAALTFLNQNRVTFENSSGSYTSTYATNYIRLMSMACEEVANDEVLFPSGNAKISEPWKKITGLAPDSAASDLETELLGKTSSMGNDYKKFALCLGAATSAQATFTNFVRKSN